MDCLKLNGFERQNEREAVRFRTFGLLLPQQLGLTSQVFEEIYPANLVPSHEMGPKPSALRPYSVRFPSAVRFLSASDFDFAVPILFRDDAPVPHEFPRRSSVALVPASRKVGGHREPSVIEKPFVSRMCVLSSSVVC